MYHFILGKYTNQELSNYTHFQLSQNPELVFIYDRTQQDVDYVMELNRKYRNGTITDEEKEIWNAGMKGVLNAADINRNEFNTAIIGLLLDLDVETKSNWTTKDIPRVSEYRRIRENVQKIRDVWPFLTDMPLVPEQPLNTYQKWNDIEKILHDIYRYYIRLQNSYYRCGEFYSGEEVGIL